MCVWRQTLGEDLHTQVEADVTVMDADCVRSRGAGMALLWTLQRQHGLLSFSFRLPVSRTVRKQTFVLNHCLWSFVTSATRNSYALSTPLRARGGVGAGGCPSDRADSGLFLELGYGVLASSRQAAVFLLLRALLLSRQPFCKILPFWVWGPLFPSSVWA